MKVFNGMQKRKSRGFTLIEMSMVLAIIGVLIGGAIKGRDMYYQSKATSEIGDLQFVITKLQAKYRNVASTATVTTTNAIQGNVFPETMITNVTTVANQFGGAVTVASATITIAGDAFLLTDTGLNKTVCQVLAAGLTSAASRVTVTNSAGIATNIHSSYGTIVQYNPGTADAACDNFNTIGITFTRS